MAGNDSTDLADVGPANAPEQPEAPSPGTENIDALDAMTEIQTVTSKLLELSGDLDLFHDDGVAYATVLIGGRRETWKVQSETLKKFLSNRYHKQTGKVPNTQALIDTVRSLEGKAIFQGPECKVFVRIARTPEAIYLDLADADRTIVKIDTDGWDFQKDAPVRFVRPRGLEPLPIPPDVGSLDALRPFVNVTDEAAWRLVLAWLVSVFFEGPYCFLVLLGRQGSAKTSTSRNLRAVVDPNRSPVRAQPRGVRDLLIAGQNSVVVVLDNISYIDDTLSDALCRMSTGGGFSTRELYTNEDEVILDVQRPGILNGITDVVTRGDLLDRSILVELPPITPDKRRPESELKEAFEAARPRVLSGLLSVVSAVMEHEPGVELPELPRMADFAIRGVALERALGWPPGSFMQAYEAAISAAHDLARDASVISPYVHLLADAGWTGTASDMLVKLNEMFDAVPPGAAPGTAVKATKLRPKGWPMSAAQLSGQLKRLVPNLAAGGVEVSFAQTHGNQSRKLITIRRTNTVDGDAGASLGQHEPGLPAPVPLPSGHFLTWPAGWPTGASGEHPLAQLTQADALPSSVSDPDQDLDESELPQDEYFDEDEQY